MIKKAGLEFYAALPGQPTLPSSDHLRHFFAGRKPRKQVEMIGHEQKKFAIPEALTGKLLG